ncbi:DUF4184 family protein [Cellulomonas sp. PS-H5]|uniref:DUF4184 family protein n=1 Tax=Cellulomonas sp. PS-H5 TaxID=2820400 RepID=UPI001C500E31|nr:DUF4184 family protein [Cellulomonas sp. PS-H5]MBW0252872.1 DUF4184 family protein [Cellulomonas sp. PS-H5]
MPFTLAHPAAVLPLARRPLVPAALVAGALAPDVPYFLPLPRSAGSWYEPFVNATTTHAWPGALTVAVPSAALLLGLWWLVRAPLRALVATGPGEPEERRGAGAPRGAASGSISRTAAWLVVSLVLGVLTHVVWDAFTHGDGALVQRVAWLREPLVSGVTAARVLQHLSTAAGLLVLALWAGRRLLAWRRAGGRPALGRLQVVGVGAVVAAGIGGVVVGVLGATGSGVEAVLSAAAKDGGTALVLAVLVAAAAWWLGRVARARTARPAGAR